MYSVQYVCMYVIRVLYVYVSCMYVIRVMYVYVLCKIISYG